MSFDYSRTAATADRLIKRFGASATWTRTTPGEYDPATGGASVSTEQTQTVQAVVLDYDHSYIDGTLIRQGDRKALISPSLDFAPVAGDTLIWAGETLTAVAVKPLAPAGKAVLYEAQMRGA